MSTVPVHGGHRRDLFYRHVCLCHMSDLNELQQEVLNVAQNLRSTRKLLIAYHVEMVDPTFCPRFLLVPITDKLQHFPYVDLAS